MDGGELRAAREARGQGQAEFAQWLNERLGRRYDRARISRWESGGERVPRQVAEVIAELRQTEEARPRVAYCVAVALQKGGVGKTSAAVNTAFLLAQGGLRVLLVDADSQSNASICIGLSASALVELDRQGRTLLQVLGGTCPVEEAIHRTEIRGLDLLPACVTLADADVSLALDPFGYRKMAQALRKVADRYDVIIIDCAPNLGKVTIAALSASDGVLIPVQVEPLALLGVNRLMDTIATVRDNANPALEILGLVPTMYTRRLTQDRATLEEMTAAYAPRFRVYDPVPRSTLYAQASGAGLPTLAAVADAPGRDTWVQVAGVVRAKAADKAADKARLPAGEVTHG